MNNKTTRNSLLLLVTAAVWGAAFVAQTVGGQAIGAYSFNCIRSIIGALVLIPVMKFLDKKNLSPKRPKTKEDYKLLIKGGICCGVALCISTNLQQVGILMGASAGKAGFLTAVYILLVPILGLFLHKKCGINIWFAVALALVGLYFLCMQDKNGFHPADLLLLCCAFGFSIQILFVDYFSPKVDGVRLSMIQFLVTGVLTSVPMFVVDMQHSIPGIEVWAQAFLSACENPEGVFKYFIEPMQDGGDVQFLWTYGVEGIHWSTAAETLFAGTENEKTYADGEFHMLENREKEGTQYTKAHIDPMLALVELANDPQEESVAAEAKESAQLFNDNCKAADLVPTTDEMSEYNGDLTTLKNELIAKVVMGEITVDDAYAQFESNHGAEWSQAIVDSLNK